MDREQIKTYAAFSLAIGLVSASLGAAGQGQSEQVTVDVGECIKLESPEARLACFEASVDTALKEREEPPAAASPPAAPAAAPIDNTAEPKTQAAAARQPPPPTPAVSQSSTTRSESRRERRDRRDTATTAEEPETLVGRIKEVREFMPNTYVITLEDGQVWRQRHSQFYPLKPGQTVRIYGTHWGSASRLTADDLKGFIQVERVF